MIMHLLRRFGFCKFDPHIIDSFSTTQFRRTDPALWRGQRPCKSQSTLPNDRCMIPLHSGFYSLDMIRIWLRGRIREFTKELSPHFSVFEVLPHRQVPLLTQYSLEAEPRFGEPNHDCKYPVLTEFLRITYDRYLLYGVCTYLKYSKQRRDYRSCSAQILWFLHSGAVSPGAHARFCWSLPK